MRCDRGERGLNRLYHVLVGLKSSKGTRGGRIKNLLPIHLGILMGTRKGGRGNNLDRRLALASSANRRQSQRDEGREKGKERETTTTHLSHFFSLLIITLPLDTTIQDEISQVITTLLLSPGAEFNHSTLEISSQILINKIPSHTTNPMEGC